MINPRVTRGRSRFAILLAATAVVFSAVRMSAVPAPATAAAPLPPPPGLPYQLLHTFGSPLSDGFNPGAELVEGADGDFYGTTQSGGDANGCGTAYKITSAGVYSLLHTFSIIGGCVPTALMRGSDDNFYGMTNNGGGGFGNIFRMTPAGAVTVLHTFTDYDAEGSTALYPLVESCGELYGTLFQGGEFGDGVAFTISLTGSNFEVLHSFGETSEEGQGPSSPLLIGSDGYFYGTMVQGGTSVGTGVLYRMDGTGDVTPLLTLDFLAGEGDTPFGGLIQTGPTTFYGTASSLLTVLLSTDPPNGGTVFRLELGGITPELTVVHSFSGDPEDPDGAIPYGRLLLADDGNIYGTTLLTNVGDLEGGVQTGTVFRIVDPGGTDTFEVVHVFNGVNPLDAGTFPVAGLTQGSDGKLYGTTGGVVLFGPGPGPGTIFTLDPGTDPGVELTIAPADVTGGMHAVGTVTIPAPAPVGGVVVNLASDTPSTATVPATVTIGAGKTSKNFNINTIPVTSDQSVEISASLTGPAATQTLIVHAPRLSQLKLNPAAVTGGSSSTGTVTLTGKAPAGGWLVNLESADPSVATVGASVLVPAGQKSVMFPVGTSVVAADTPVVITAFVGCGDEVDATLTVKTAALQKLDVMPGTVTGSAGATGTVTLNGPAPAGGASIIVSSNNVVAGVTSPVVVPAGLTSKTFAITTTAPTGGGRGGASATATISATYLGVTKTKNLTVKK